MDKKRAHHISAPISPNYHGFGHSTSDSLFDDYPPPAYQPPHNMSASLGGVSGAAMHPPPPIQSKSIQNLNNFNQTNQFYHPTPPPQTVIIYRQPTRSKDACCWGCLAALCLCFGAKECC
ncbi:hypothetical protein HMPREF1544_09017 [Mucor circinelloides 1006PhL]|uniref:Uncharacterized protein n=1 Tax=Mucor circinelloides f. circinelloides (strain 1006PhL) TaxID=1220926 RepID=S2JWL1_MUCC1|nr:hypothetical protein HMPREF1544_09017 [Mucor circinelloides 1006PhL]